MSSTESEQQNESTIADITKIKNENKVKNEVDIEGFVDNFQRFYNDGAIDGFITEAWANIWDAYLHENDLVGDRQLVIQMEFDTGSSFGAVEDNAGGMTPETLDGFFTNFEKSKKALEESETTGFHGRGTAIFQDISNGPVFIETKHEEAGTTKAIWTPEETLIQKEGEDLSDIDPRFAEDKLENTGTRIELYDMDDQYLQGDDSISDREHLKMVVRKWWNQFLKNPNVRVTLNIDGEFSTIDPIKFERRAIESKDLMDGETFENDAGVEIEEFTVYLFDGRRPEPYDDLVLMENQNHQIIKHYSPHHIQNSRRMIAVVRTNKEMRKFEKDSHRGYSKRGNKVVKELERFVKRKIDAYADDKFTGEGSNMSESEKEALNEGAAAFTRLANESSVFNDIKGNRQKGPEGPEEDETPDDLYADRMGFVDHPKFKKYGYEDDIEAFVEVKNPEDGNQEKAKGEIKLELLHPSGADVRDEVIKTIGTKRTGEIAENEYSTIQFQFKTPDDSYEAGKYRVRATVTTEKKHGTRDIPETNWFRLNKDPETTEGTQTRKGINGFTPATNFDNEDLVAKFSEEDSVILLNEEHPEYRAMKERSEDDELDTFGFDVSLQVMKQREINNKVDDSQSTKEVKAEIKEVEDNCNSIRTKYYTERTDEMGGKA